MKIILIILILISLLPLSSQYLEDHQYPPGIKWKKIDVQGFEVIFPEEITYEGQRVASFLEYINPFITENLKKKQKTISLFLSNSGIFSNGYVQLAPRKSEWYSTPPQSMFLGNLDWYSGLALHEGRHIYQFEKLNRGFTRTSSILFGELGRALFTFFSAPQWYFEGDSVFTETIFSGGGRGRVPDFEMGTRALLLSEIKYSYNKSYLSSYKDFTPGVYSLGYFLVSHLKRNYPPDTINKILKHSSSYSFYPLIFYNSIKKYTGRSMNEIYSDAMDELKEIWEGHNNKTTKTEFRKINRKKKGSRTLYTYPRFLENGNIIVQKHSLSLPLTLIEMKKNGKEEKIKVIRPIGSYYNNLSVNGDLVVWSEPKSDPRWQKRSYAEIVIFNIRNRRTRRITSGSRLFSPSLSPGGNKIAAVRFSKKRLSSLVILDTQSGKILNEIDARDKKRFITPVWDRSGKNIAVIIEQNGKTGLSLYNTETLSHTEIISPVYENISDPVFYRNHVLYGSSYSGINNIYAVNVNTAERFRITSSKFGSFYPEVSPDEKRLVYCDYNILGMDIVEINLEKDTWVPFDQINTARTEYFKNPLNRNSLKNITIRENIPEKVYPVKKYNRFKNLLNFHSWIINPSLPEPSIEIYSNNKLNTTSVTGGLRYNTNEKTSRLFAKAEYGGLFPRLSLELSSGERYSGEPGTSEWNETELNFNIRVPLNLSRGAFNKFLSISSELSLINISSDSNFPVNGNIFSLSYRLNYLNYKIFSKRDLQPRWGWYLSTVFTHTPGNNFYKGELFSFKGGVYLPGIFKHNHLKLSFAYEKQDPLNYIFSSYIPFSKGYDQVFHKNLIYASADYSFPIAYPDFSMGKLLYLKRIKGNIFYNYLRGYDTSVITNYNSAGVEIRGDMNLLTIPVDLEAGCR
ncbi:MAG: hypothetical protein ABFR75_13140, partial [Acidobacteriota bacterium]